MAQADYPADSHPLQDRSPVPRKPSICFVVRGSRQPSFDNQTVTDYQVLRNVDEETALAESAADRFLWLRGDRLLRPQAAEECIWGLESAEWVTWKDTGEAPPPSLRECAGPLGVARGMLEQKEPQRSGTVRRLSWNCRLDPQRSSAARRKELDRGVSAAAEGRGLLEKPKPAPFGFDRPVAASAPGFVANLARLYQHLRNAELLSLNTWLAQPARAAVRLIPLRLKQGINQWMGRPFFDLRFYLRFQPSAALIEGKLIKQLEYQPCRRRQGCRRIALLTPHLGVGGPEQTLLEFARQLDRSQFEIFLIGTHSKDSRLRPEWERSVDHIYDLAKLAPDGMSEQFLFSLPLNWQFDILLMQNSIPAYRVLPALKHRRPAIRIVDILHTADEDWDLFSKALDVADHLDRTIVVSGTGRRRLLDMAVPAEKIRLIRSGVDLARFDPRRFERGRLHRRLGLPASTKIILYAGRLEPNKQPLLLPAIAEELNALLPGGDFHIVVAGDGPERERLYARVKTKGLENRFSLLGHVPDVAELLADIALLVIPAASSGVPLILLEALAMEAPVVACRGSAIEEALPHSRGKLVEAGEYVENRLASAIQELLIDAGRRAEMGRAGRALVEREYSLVRARRQYRELIAELGA